MPKLTTQVNYLKKVEEELFKPQELTFGKNSQLKQKLQSDLFTNLTPERTPNAILTQSGLCRSPDQAPHKKYFTDTIKPSLTQYLFTSPDRPLQKTIRMQKETSQFLQSKDATYRSLDHTSTVAAQLINQKKEQKRNQKQINQNLKIKLKLLFNDICKAQCLKQQLYEKISSKIKSKEYLEQQQIQLGEKTMSVRGLIDQFICNQNQSNREVVTEEVLCKVRHIKQLNQQVQQRRDERRVAMYKIQDRLVVTRQLVKDLIRDVDHLLKKISQKERQEQLKFQFAIKIEKKLEKM